MPNQRTILCLIAGPLVTILSACGEPSPAVSENPQVSLPPAYLRSVIADPKLLAVAHEFQHWALTANTSPKGRPLFSRAEVLPVAQTVLPYGVGVYQKEPRLPVILTTGPGWDDLSEDDREKLIVSVYNELARRLDHDGFCPPTLTLQTPQGLLLAWDNGPLPEMKLLHGDLD